MSLARGSFLWRFARAQAVHVVTAGMTLCSRRMDWGQRLPGPAGQATCNSCRARLGLAKVWC